MRVNDIVLNHVGISQVSQYQLIRLTKRMFNSEVGQCNENCLVYVDYKLEALCLCLFEMVLNFPQSTICSLCLATGNRPTTALTSSFDKHIEH